MTRESMPLEEIRAGFLAELTGIAPELAPGEIAETAHLQEDLGLDSMDFLNLVAALHRRFGVAVPEADYPRLATPAAAVDYLAAALG